MKISTTTTTAPTTTRADPLFSIFTTADCYDCVCLCMVWMLFAFARVSVYCSPWTLVLMYNLSPFAVACMHKDNFTPEMSACACMCVVFLSTNTVFVWVWRWIQLLRLIYSWTAVGMRVIKMRGNMGSRHLSHISQVYKYLHERDRDWDCVYVWKST